MQKFRFTKGNFILLPLALMCSFLSLAAQQSQHPQAKEKISIAAIDWCPQICPKDENHQGYIVDLVNEIYPKNEFDVQIDYVPWSRAIKYTRDGQAEAILSPAKAEAPDLIYPEQEIGSQTMCFFTLQDSMWNYQGIPSLVNLTIGIAQDTSIEELNEYVEKNRHQFQFQPYLDRYVEQNIGKLTKGRIDTFLFTKNTVLFLLEKNPNLPRLRNAGCVSSAKIYMAFSPQMPPEKAKKLIKQHDDKLSKMHRNGDVDKILKQYGLLF